MTQAVNPYKTLPHKALSCLIRRLTYSTHCCVDPTDSKAVCDIVNANHAKREERARTAEAYHKQVLDPLKGMPGGK